MAILKELLALHEDKQPIDITTFRGKNTSDAAVKDFLRNVTNKHWGNDTLTWHGDKFFDGGALGAAYNHAIDNAKAEMKDLELEYTFNPVHYSDEDGDYSIDIELNNITIADSQECYLGYDTASDCLIS